MASIKDVAGRANVSIATVSNVLNKTKYVSEELTRRVLDSVRELDYQADPVAQNMKAGRSKTIGVITTDICGLFYPYILKGLFEVFNANGYNMILLDTNGMNEREGCIKRVLDGFAQLVRNRVDGIVFSSIFPEDQEQYYVGELLKMADGRKKVEIVSVETNFDKYGIDSVYCDSVEGAVTATNHLIDQGARHIGHITGPFYTRVAQDRCTGCIQALRDHGMELNERFIAHGDYTHQSGYLAMQQLLTNAPEIDGVFVANDQMSVGALRALAEAGRHVPQDVKVIGYDDVFIASVLQPSLSTVHVQKHRMGEEAARLLIGRLNNENNESAKAIQLESRLVVRRTTVLDAKEDWIQVDW